MVTRIKNVTQADIERAIRAVQAAGLHIIRVVAKPDGFAIETAGNPASNGAEMSAPKPRMVL